jgi:potassium-transporting ATPase KdpC subunit
MKNLGCHLRIACLVTLILALVCGGLYPLVVYGLSQVLFPAQANGSLVLDAQGVVRGSKLIGQPFASDSSFHPRPSAAGTGYDAANSSGSNLGPTSKKLADDIAQRVAEYREQNGLTTNDAVPADAVCSSGSGLDPHISVRNAELQAPRVARARHLSEDRVRSLIQEATDPPDLGILGEPRVKVLMLNFALDQKPARPTQPK